MNFSTRVVLYVIVAISLSQYALELADIEDAFVLLCVVLIFEYVCIVQKLGSR